MKVFIPQDVAESGKEFLRKNGYELRIGPGYSPDILMKELADCDGVLARTAVFDADVLAAGPTLKVIARHGVGFDNIDIDLAAEKGIWVTNTPEALSSTVAEHAIGLMLAVGRGYIKLDRAVRSGDFSIRTRMAGVDIHGKIMGLIGLGRIGREVARRAGAGLGMQIIAYDPYVQGAVPGVELLDSVEEVLRRADFVSLHLPSTKATRGLIDSEKLGLMKPTAYFINTARGDIVDEEALIQTLQAGSIAGAAIDVYAQEPPDPANPLFTLENTVVMPHAASLTYECTSRMSLHAAQSIHEVLSGQRPNWPVNNPPHPR